MNFFIVSRGDDISEQTKDDIQERLISHGFEVNEDNPELVISIGGDGTLLKAFHRFQGILAHTSFVGVHTGRLGFYADWRPHETEELVNCIIHSPMQVVTYPLLEAIVYHEDGREERFLALNECTVKMIEGSLVMDVEIGKELFETFRGDGLCISTPSGSTAYNKSLGGALVHPSIPALQLAEMASINNRVYRTIGSPLILPEHHTCHLKPHKNMDHQFTIDHHTRLMKNVTSMSFKVAPESIRFVRYRLNPFWKRVRYSFIGDHQV